MHTGDLLYVKLIPSIQKGTPSSDFDSWALNARTGFRAHETAGFLAPGERKGRDLAFFQDLPPRQSGGYDVELATVLPDFFPNAPGRSEYVLEVGPGKTRLHVSNTMRRVRLLDSSHEPVYHTFPERMLPQYVAWHQATVGSAPHVENLRTAVAWRTSLDGATADEALSNGLSHAVDQFVALINAAISAFLRVDQSYGLVTPVHDRLSLSVVYVIIKGGAERMETLRVSPSVHRVMMAPPDLDLLKWQDVERVLAQEATGADPRQMMNSAGIFLSNGNLDFALLLMVVAAETAVSRYVRKRWEETGVSKGQIDEVAKEITFSQNLKLHLPSLCPPNRKPDLAMLGRVGRARKLRNEFMHEGKRAINRGELTQCHDAVVALVSFLEAL